MVEFRVKLTAKIDATYSLNVQAKDWREAVRKAREQAPQQTSLWEVNQHGRVEIILHEVDPVEPSQGGKRTMQMFEVRVTENCSSHDPYVANLRIEAEDEDEASESAITEAIKEWEWDESDREFVYVSDIGAVA